MVPAEADGRVVRSRLRLRRGLSTFWLISSAAAQLVLRWSVELRPRSCCVLLSPRVGLELAAAGGRGGPVGRTRHMAGYPPRPTSATPRRSRRSSAGSAARLRPPSTPDLPSASALLFAAGVEPHSAARRLRSPAAAPATGGLVLAARPAAVDSGQRSLAGTRPGILCDVGTRISVMNVREQHPKPSDTASGRGPPPQAFPTASVRRSRPSRTPTSRRRSGKSGKQRRRIAPPAPARLARAGSE